MYYEPPLTSNRIIFLRGNPICGGIKLKYELNIEIASKFLSLSYSIPHMYHYVMIARNITASLSYLVVALLNVLSQALNLSMADLITLYPSSSYGFCLLPFLGFTGIMRGKWYISGIQEEKRSFDLRLNSHDAFRSLSMTDT